MSGTPDYPVILREEARKLHREGDWNPTEIRRIFARRGVSPLPTPSAIRWWICGGTDFDRQMEHQRRHKARVVAKRSGGRMLGRERTPEFRLERIKALHAIDMTYAAIAKVMTFDFPHHPLDDEQVRRIISRGALPRKWTRSEAA